MIRFTKVQESLWYSLSDIIEFLNSRNCLSSGKNLSFLMRDLQNKKSKKVQYSFNQPLAVFPFDEFYNWVVFSSLYQFMTQKEKEKVKKTGILQFIDFNNIEEAKKQFPEIANEFTECFLSISFNDRATST